METQYLEEIVARYSARREMLLVALQEIQDHAGYIPGEIAASLAHALQLNEGEVRAVVSFYKELRTTPPGRHRFSVCKGDSCAATGANRLLAAAETHLGTPPGSVSPGGHFTFDAAHCLGNCALSPAVAIDGEVYGRVSPETVARLLEEWEDD